jgi:hypothetical protein
VRVVRKDRLLADTDRGVGSPIAADEIGSRYLPQFAALLGLLRCPMQSLLPSTDQTHAADRYIACAVAGCGAIWEYELMMRYGPVVFVLRVCQGHVLSFGSDKEPH